MADRKDPPFGKSDPLNYWERFSKFDDIYLETLDRLGPTSINEISHAVLNAKGDLSAARAGRSWAASAHGRGLIDLVDGSDALSDPLRLTSKAKEKLSGS
jgi:hypothetical protein